MSEERQVVREMLDAARSARNAAGVRDAVCRIAREHCQSLPSEDLEMELIEIANSAEACRDALAVLRIAESEKQEAT